jgi:hypothetical protein
MLPNWDISTASRTDSKPVWLFFRHKFDHAFCPKKIDGFIDHMSQVQGHRSHEPSPRPAIFENGNRTLSLVRRTTAAVAFQQKCEPDVCRAWPVNIVDHRFAIWA